MVSGGYIGIWWGVQCVWWGYVGYVLVHIKYTVGMQVVSGGISREHGGCVYAA